MMGIDKTLGMQQNGKKVTLRIKENPRNQMDVNYKIEEYSLPLKGKYRI